MIESPLTVLLTLIRRSTKFFLAFLLIVASILPTAQLAHAQGQVHTVAYGETLANIAYAYEVNSTELARANGVVNTNMLYIGQQLTIPSGSVSSAPAASQPEVSTANTDAAAVEVVTTDTIDAIVSAITEEPAEEAVAVADESSVAESPAASSVTVAGGYVAVSSDDTLSQIAEDHGMSLSEIMRMNSLEDENQIFVGQQLYVTNSTAATAASAATTILANTTLATTDATAEAASTETVAVAESTTAAASIASSPASSTAASPADAIYTVTYGDTLSNIAARYGVSGASVIEANGLPNANHVWIGQKLRIPDGANANVTQTTSWPQASQSPAAYGRKLIEVDLSKQTLTAWQGDQQMLHTFISSGTYKTPTVTGRFLVSWKLASQHMYGDDFDLPGVPWVMYFHEGYAIHGAYWHNNFGMPMSHGCVNMVPSQAQFLYEWAPVGTEIWVHY